MSKDTSDYSAYSFLIVEDKPLIRGLVDKMLVRCSARQIIHAGDGIKAMKALSERRDAADCVLCDYRMEPMDGLALLRAVRSGQVRNAQRGLRFIMLTGYADASVVKIAIALDVNGYLVKPVSMEKLIQAVDKAFAKPTPLKAPETYLAVDLVKPPDETNPPGGAPSG